MMAWSSLAYSVLMRCLRSSGSVMCVLYTFLWGNRQSRLTASSLDPANPPLQTASRSNQPFFHNELDKCLSSRENGILMTSDLYNYYIVLYLRHKHWRHKALKAYLHMPSVLMPSVLWRCWLGVRKGIRPVKNWVVGWWRGCLGWGADLHIAQQMPLPLTISCSSKSRL